MDLKKSNDRYLRLKAWHANGPGCVHVEHRDRLPSIYSIVVNQSLTVQLKTSSSLSIAIESYNSHQLHKHLDIHQSLISKSGLNGFYVNVNDLINGEEEIRWYYHEKFEKFEKRVVIPKETYIKALPEFGDF